MWHSAKISLSLLIFVYSNIIASSYYVDGNMPSSGNGLAPASAFKTIQECATVAKAGDICFIRAGTYRETVSPHESGTENNPIIFQNYNNESVIIDGAEKIEGWTLYSGNIYKASISWTLGAENQVFANDTMIHLARWPNIKNQVDPFFDFSNYASADLPASGNGHIFDNDIPDKPDNFWQNAIIWGNFGAKWSAFGTLITNSKGKDLYYSTPSNMADWYAYPGATPVWGKNQPNDFEMYYLSGKIEFLDTANEWFHDGKYLYVWVNGGGNPGTAIKAKKRGLAFNLSHKSFISIKNLTIFASTISMQNANGCVLDNINMKYLSHHSMQGFDHNLPYAFISGGNGITISGSHNQVINSIIKYTAGSAISISDGNDHVIDNNDIEYTNYNNSYSEAIISHGTGTGTLLTRNKIWYSGSCLIQADKYGANDNGTIVLYNDLAFGDQLSDDRGALNGSNWEVAYNWIHDIGRGLKFGITPGIYTDLALDYATYHHNVIWNLFGIDPGVRVNNTGNENGNIGIFIYNNTSFNTPGENEIYTGSWMWTAENNLANSPSNNFINTSTGDFRLASGSTGINNGKAISDPGNITMESVGNPDNGAYEYGAKDAYSNWNAGLNTTIYYLGNFKWQNLSSSSVSSSSSISSSNISSFNSNTSSSILSSSSYTGTTLINLIENITVNSLNTNRLEVRFALELAGNYRIQLWNINGQLVYDSFWNYLTIGEKSIKWNRPLHAGVYELRIQCPSGKLNRAVHIH